MPGVLPALPAATIPGTYADGTLILGGNLDTLSVVVVHTSAGSYSGSFQAYYVCSGGTKYSVVGNGQGLLMGSWCVVPPGSPAPIGTCPLPAGWSAHANGKWDLPPGTTGTTPSTWGRLKILYR